MGAPGVRLNDLRRTALGSTGGLRPASVLGGVTAVAENRALCALGRCRAVRGNGDQEPKPARAYTTTAGHDARGARLTLPGLDTEAAREMTPLPGFHDPRGRNDPGGLPRDRNTPRIETRRIPDLETLGNHEP